MPRKIIVLHSGGLDSTVCLLLAREKGFDVISLGIDYGQRSSVELEYANNQCKRFNIPRKVLRIEWDKPSVVIPVDRTIQDIRMGVSSAFLPGRNAIFLCLACAEAAGLEANEVWIGINSVDFSGYPDCRSQFIHAFRAMIKEAFLDPPEIVVPLIYMNKPQIAQEAYRLGLYKNETWSCYTPVKTSDGIKPCERCDACKLSNYAWSFLDKS
jgi:7-cyano-7-deazaguanine synthase